MNHAKVMFNNNVQQSTPKQLESFYFQNFLPEVVYPRVLHGEPYWNKDNVFPSQANTLLNMSKITANIVKGQKLDREITTIYIRGNIGTSDWNYPIEKMPALGFLRHSMYCST